jgi:ribosome maturation factor RimP
MVSKMNELEKKIYELAADIGEVIHVRVLDVEDVKEHGMRIIRVTADTDEGLTVDDSTALNEALSQKLDEIDPIDGEYFLEVTSPGIERELKTDGDIAGAIGKYICIKGYEKIENEKEIYGTLVDYDGEKVTIDARIKQFSKKVQVEKKKIAKIRLAVKF